MTLPREPRCMTPAEITAWWRTNRSITSAPDRDDSPCRDCSQLFANGMRIVGRCNGSYPGENGPEPEKGKRTTWHPTWAYPSEEERVEARRASWRSSQARRRMATA